MEKTTMSRILIETTVRQTLKSLQEDPKRSVRNLLDMALQFSQGRFQSDFFAAARTMLENEDSAYYTLIQDAAAHIETEHLVRFGMNLGYNGCTQGARRIRANEKRLGFNIPWTVLLCLDGSCSAKSLQSYHTVIAEGEGLGIYTWMLFVRDIDPTELLPLMQNHPDSAFFLFCAPGTAGDAFPEAADSILNLMPVVYLGDAAGAACRRLRDRNLPYSVWTTYAQAEAAAITGGELFDAAQRLHPVFTALMPRRDCLPETRAAVNRAAVAARTGQCYATVPWELHTDTCRLDKIISDDSCWVFFDSQGKLYPTGSPQREGDLSLFADGLTEVLRRAFPKTETSRSR